MHIYEYYLTTDGPSFAFLPYKASRACNCNMGSGTVVARGVNGERMAKEEKRGSLVIPDTRHIYGLYAVYDI